MKFALPFILQVWMIVSPIFYPTSILSEKWRIAFAVNPLTGILDGFRSTLFGMPFDWRVIGVSFVSTVILLVISLLIFKRMEDDFADLIENSSATENTEIYDCEFICVPSVNSVAKMQVIKVENLSKLIFGRRAEQFTARRARKLR